jgi:sortase A
MGDGSRPVEFVGGEDDGGALEGGAGDDPVDEIAATGIEPGVGLVEQPQARAAHGDGGERGAAALTGREAVGGDVAQPAIETETGQGGVGRAGAGADGAGREPDVLLDREVAVEETGVPEQPHEGSNRPGVDPEIVPEDDRVPLGDAGKPGAGAQERGLASAVRSLEVDHLAGGDVEVDARQRGEPAEEADSGAKVDSGLHQGGSTVLARSRKAPSSTRRADGVRRAIRGFGKALIGAGLLILLFVVYQLWGTNLAEARSQDRLRGEFADALAESPVVSAPPSRPGAPTTTPAPIPAPPPPPTGEAVAILRIPKIGLEKAVVEGVGVKDLQKGPGHYPSTPMPGQPGNAAIAGHRTTYGAPFNRIDELEAGDEIEITTLQGSFRYEVSEAKIVSPKAVEVLDASGDNRLTLTSCHPKLSARQRIVVIATLARDVAPAPTLPPTTTTTTPGTSGGTRPPQRSIPTAAEEFGLGGDRSARLPAALWGLGCALVAAAAWLWGQRWRRLGAYLLSTPVLFVVLFFWFEQINRLLPANV